MTLDEKRVREIRERAEKATMGPWVKRNGLNGGMDVCACLNHINGLSAYVGISSHERDVRFEVEYQGRYRPFEDAEFIAHAREDIPFLLAHLDALARENAALRKMRDTVQSVRDFIHDEIVTRCAGVPENQVRKSRLVIAPMLMNVRDMLTDALAQAPAPLCSKCGHRHDHPDYCAMNLSRDGKLNPGPFCPCEGPAPSGDGGRGA